MSVPMGPFFYNPAGVICIHLQVPACKWCPVKILDSDNNNVNKSCVFVPRLFKKMSQNLQPNCPTLYPIISDRSLVVTLRNRLLGFYHKDLEEKQ